MSAGELSPLDRARAMLDSALDSVITIDASGRVIEFNHSAEQLFGFRAGTGLREGIERTVAWYRAEAPSYAAR